VRLRCVTLCTHEAVIPLLICIQGQVAAAIGPTAAQRATAQRRVWTCALTGLAVGSLVGVALLTRTPELLGMLGMHGPLVDAAATYVRIRALAMPLQLVAMVCNAASIGVRDSTSPLRITAVGAAINCVGDFVLCQVRLGGILTQVEATNFTR
jgi:Na+-driven multidrug efflux pump